MNNRRRDLLDSSSSSEDEDRPHSVSRQQHVQQQQQQPPSPPPQSLPSSLQSHLAGAISDAVVGVLQGLQKIVDHSPAPPSQRRRRMRRSEASGDEEEDTDDRTMNGSDENGDFSELVSSAVDDADLRVFYERGRSLVSDRKHAAQATSQRLRTCMAELQGSSFLFFVSFFLIPPPAFS